MALPETHVVAFEDSRTDTVLLQEAFACAPSVMLLGVFPRLCTVDADVVVLDSCLPEGHGAELLQLVRERYPNTPILVWTGKESPDAYECAGAARVVTKNFSSVFALPAMCEELHRTAVQRASVQLQLQDTTRRVSAISKKT